MKVTPITGNLVKTKVSNINNKPDNSEPVKTNNLNSLQPQFNDMLMFTARVDKGLERFYDKNQDIMPVTVKTYIENLPDKSMMTPLEAQRRAFEYLTIADSIEDIVAVYPEFENLKNAEKTRATSGILYSIRDNAELLNLMGESPLKSGENFTLYLVKKNLFGQ